MFLKFKASGNSSIEVHIQKVYDHQGSIYSNFTNYTILPDIELPTTSFDPLSIVKSYPENVSIFRVTGGLKKGKFYVLFYLKLSKPPD